MTKQNDLIEFLGWVGALAILGAYISVSFNVISAKSVTYQLLNLFGAVGIMFDSYHHRAIQSVTINIIWALLALVALVRVFAF